MQRSGGPRKDNGLGQCQELSSGQCSWVAVGLYNTGNLSPSSVRLKGHIVLLWCGAAWEAVSPRKAMRVSMSWHVSLKNMNMWVSRYEEKMDVPAKKLPGYQKPGENEPKVEAMRSGQHCS